MTEVLNPKANAGQPHGQKFRSEIRVRFGHCDPAGIVFYPRYFEMINDVVDDWTRTALQFSFNDMIISRGYGLPTVHIEVDFVAPSVFGDVLSAELSVRKLGTSSISIDVVLRGPDGMDRVRANVVLVLTNKQENQAIPVPTEIRERIALFQALQ